MSELKDFLKQNRLAASQPYIAKRHVIREIKSAFDANKFTDYVYNRHDNPALTPEEKALFPEDAKYYGMLVAPFTEEIMHQIYLMAHGDEATIKMKRDEQNDVFGYDPVTGAMFGRSW